MRKNNFIGNPINRLQEKTEIKISGRIFGNKRKEVYSLEPAMNIVVMDKTKLDNSFNLL
jgi:hypothetical protein